MLADLADVSRQTINAIETEKYDPSLPLAFKLAAIFGVAIEEIFNQSIKHLSLGRDTLIFLSALTVGALRFSFRSIAIIGRYTGVQPYTLASRTLENSVVPSVRCVAVAVR